MSEGFLTSVKNRWVGAWQNTHKQMLYDPVNLAYAIEKLAKFSHPSEKAGADDTVLLNHRVKLYDLNKGKTLYVTVVMPRYADTANQRISAFSHFGVALLGAKLHSTVKVQQAWLQRSFLITAIGPVDKTWQEEAVVMNEDEEFHEQKTHD